MILDRILKGFWGRYALYLSAFVALYFLMREKLDSIIFGLWDSWITVGVNQYISIFLACLLSCYPAYNLLSKRKKGDTITASPVVFIFIPISVWFIIQKVWTTDKAHYLEKDAAFQIILYFTIIYLIMLVLSHLNRHKAREAEPSLLIKDEPIENKGKDELGFTLYVESISKNICSIVNNKHSFVFGIEGSWGSGKTSFVNLVKEHLEKHSHIRQLDFNPWMSGSAQQMTTDFFSLMAENTSSMRLRIKFREYGNALASADGTGIVGKIVESISPSQDLGTMLESINECIAREQLRFVVFIDDTDRLDKEELLSVFKLVRNTASFSNTIFILTYDRNYVDSILTSYFENSSIAEAYTDKIVNFQFELPSSTNDYYKILRREINDSEFIKAYPEIGLNDNDLPEEITSLFDSYRKVKRVFNALTVESGLPHFKKIPVKYTLVFFYMAYYRKEEYEMMKDAYTAFEIDSLDYFIIYQLSNLKTGQSILKLIERRNNIKEPDSSIEANILEEKKSAFEKFKNNNACTYYLLDNKDRKNIVKYFSFLFKLNAIHYKEYKERYNKYDIDGYKGLLPFELSKSHNILDRLLVIKREFGNTFYEECCIEIGDYFVKEEYKKVTNETIEEYCNFIVALALNYRVYDEYVKQAVETLIDYHTNSDLDKNILLAILAKVDNLDAEEDYYSTYFKNFEPSQRYNVITKFYETFKLELDNDSRHLPFTIEELLDCQIEHLKQASATKQDYIVVRSILLSCTLPKKGIDTRAYDAFRIYIEEFKPEQFLVDFVQPTQIPYHFEINLSLHLVKTFGINRDATTNYFNSLSYSDADLAYLKEFTLSQIGSYFNPDNTLSGETHFAVDVETFNRIKEIREKFDAKQN